ncbi:MaoC family dehydratase [Mesorhizobium sp. M0761]|uniref:MaoC family dehydratase n=1 Tax=unclassified Mesorhizobium TaxID=325217 RepID=UPI0003CE9876|nr:MULTISPECIES: MaoC family dehydratase [unclassified Mesorhizobium]ESW66626.1 MaoC family dehydratase [Mesorhizobium sp. LSJC277A00]ESX62964.1 MaoC family dehydratase [Mesorhizobium sp. LSHC422A00]
MSLDAFFRIGDTINLGSHTFEAEAIKAFACKYDPQVFHVDEEAAKKSVFGRLCASGWHTAATWMKLNLKNPMDASQWTGPGPVPEFGPSPGFRNLKWPKPVYAGETVTFMRTALSHRPLANRPGWRLLALRSEGLDSTGDKVLEFDSAVLVKAG